MKSIEMILAIVVTISFLLKVSFMSRRMQLVVALVYGVFAWLSMGWMTHISHDVFTQALAGRPSLLNLGVCLTIEAIVMMAWCFTSRPSPLTYYPGLLVAAAVCYVQAQLLWLLPGSSFTLMAWLSAVGVFLLTLLGNWLLCWLMPEPPLRKEMLFIVSLMVLLLCIVITGVPI